eukprot:CAMPEP_0203863548 /NCGR_PEP_ID=MMETSP0359-20131031/14234_1 /ASSEMBLY_ACC=CAM_ASM_000338 /TAXON_ID=268821 /ORGANISM="Scrippsiella Hangoei, Strain SHTV-5" /LENGTH=59 /DNA_ID=CAMNT_0050781115 /DNA_START=21 /DNA_END=200 /DNA_ORIENTATION=+
MTAEFRAQCWNVNAMVGRCWSVLDSPFKISREPRRSFKRHDISWRVGANKTAASKVKAD